MTEPARIGIVTVSDRAARGDYEDKGGPAIVDELTKILVSDWEAVEVVIPDERDIIEETLIITIPKNWTKMEITFSYMPTTKKKEEELKEKRILSGFSA